MARMSTGLARWGLTWPGGSFVHGEATTALCTKVLHTLLTLCPSSSSSTFHPTTDSEGEARVVRSQKDRAWDAIRETVMKIKNARKNEDWSLYQDEFDAVNKKIEKSKMLIMRDGLPKFYIKMLAEVEDAVNEIMNDKAAFKNLKSAAQHSLKRMKLNVKKHNIAYEAQIAAYRANPDDYKSDVDEDEDDEDSSDEEDSDEDDSDKVSSRIHVVAYLDLFGLQ